MCGKYSLTKFANFLIIVLRTEIATTVKAEKGENELLRRKFTNFMAIYFPHITTFFNQILGFYYF